MTIGANILQSRNEFIAELSDGRTIENSDLHALCEALHGIGVLARNTHCQWRSGHRILTAGQQVALKAELRKLERGDPRGVALAA